MGGVRIGSLRNNRLVEVSFDHTSRELAVEVVDELIRQYTADTLERRSASIKTLQGGMEKELREIKADLDKKDAGLVDFYNKNKLLLSDERQNVFVRPLDEMQSMLTRKTHELQILEAKARIVEGAAGDPHDLVAAALTNDLPALAAAAAEWGDNLLKQQAVIDEPTVRELMTQFLAASKELETATGLFRPDHPEFAAAAARHREVRAKLLQQAKIAASGILLDRGAQRTAVAQLRKDHETLKEEQLRRDSLLIQAEGLRKDRDDTRALYEALRMRVKETGISNDIATTNVHVLSAGQAGQAPVRPNLFTNLMIGLVIASFAGVAVTALVEKIDNTVRTPEDIEIPYGLPVLAVVPERSTKEAAGPPALVCWQDERSQMAESYRQLRASVLLSVREVEGGILRTILFSSPGPGEGKTVSACNLSISLAQMGNRTLLIDTDFHRSESHKLFGLDRDKGLSTLLVSDIPFAQAVQRTAIPFLDFMATGMVPPQPASLLGSARMKWVLEEAARQYTRVIIDTPPLIAVTDAAMLVPYVDALVLVVTQGKTMKTGLRRALQTLSRIGCRPLGFVFNGVKAGLGDFYFKYHHPTYSGYRSDLDTGAPVGSGRSV
jgi:capsular exopolysaccharide synthesis family protein